MKLLAHCNYFCINHLVDDLPPEKNAVVKRATVDELFSLRILRTLCGKWWMKAWCELKVFLWVLRILVSAMCDADDAGGLRAHKARHKNAIYLSAQSTPNQIQPHEFPSFSWFWIQPLPPMYHYCTWFRCFPSTYPFFWASFRSRHSLCSCWVIDRCCLKFCSLLNFYYNSIAFYKLSRVKGRKTQKSTSTSPSLITISIFVCCFSTEFTFIYAAVFNTLCTFYD